VNRDSILWLLVVFFGASVVFGTLARLTEDESAGVRIVVQVGALALIVAVIVVVVRRVAPRPWVLPELLRAE